MKKIIALILTALMLVSVFAACGEKADGDVVKIGIYEPASGSNGAGGKQEALGIKYANSIQPTVDIGGKTYIINYLDLAPELTKSLAAFREGVNATGAKTVPKE